MDDDIQLPPLPKGVFAMGVDAWIDEARRDAIRFDRERRARRAKVEVKPVVHETTLRLAPDGYAWHGTDIETKFPPRSTLVTICWTADGRAWIESEQNRELAKRLRNRHVHARLDAADALDGGER